MEVGLAPSATFFAGTHQLFSNRAQQTRADEGENVMKPYLGLGFAMLAGAVFGAAAVNGLNAQTKPGAYAVVDITEVSDPDLFKTLLPKAGPAMTAAGGQFVIRTEKITALDGAAPKRFIVIAFDSVDKAKAWNDSAAQKEVNDIRLKSTRSRSFIADGGM
jgi:uncharacterized protein (DUF1330 family)